MSTTQYSDAQIRRMLVAVNSLTKDEQRRRGRAWYDTCEAEDLNRFGVGDLTTEQEERRIALFEQIVLAGIEDPRP